MTEEHEDAHSVASAHSSSPPTRMSEGGVPAGICTPKHAEALVCHLDHVGAERERLRVFVACDTGMAGG